MFLDKLLVEGPCVTIRILDLRPGFPSGGCLRISHEVDHEGIKFFLDSKEHHPEDRGASHLSNVLEPCLKLWNCSYIFIQENIEVAEWMAHPAHGGRLPHGNGRSGESFALKITRHVFTERW